MRNALLLVALGACAGSQPLLGRQSAILEWHVSQALWGVETFVIEADGEATYRYVPVQGRDRPSEEASLLLSQSDLDQLRAVLAKSDVCSLRTGRDGIPDEGMPSLRVRMTGLSCTVELWDGEWDDNARARPIGLAVKHLRERVRASQ